MCITPPFPLHLRSISGGRCGLVWETVTVGVVWDVNRLLSFPMFFLLCVCGLRYEQYWMPWGKLHIITPCLLSENLDDSTLSRFAFWHTFLSFGLVLYLLCNLPCLISPKSWGFQSIAFQVSLLPLHVMTSQGLLAICLVSTAHINHSRKFPNWFTRSWLESQ